MKNLEIVVDRETGKVTISREAEQKLTGNQRFILWLAAIGGAVWVITTYLVGFYGFLWGVALTAFCIVRSYGKIDF